VFEEVDARLDQALSQQSSGEANSEVSDKPQTEANQPTQPQGPLELEKVERFKYEGREWTPQELKSAMMMQADYTRKTQEIAQERKYYENLSSDLRSVRENPALAEEFKKVYPEKFHNYLEYISQNTQSASQAQQYQQQSIQQQVVKPSIDPEFKARFEQLESAWKEQEVQKAQAQLDSIYDKFSKKYEMADERVVTATAQHLLSQGTKLDESTWEKLFKQEHDRTQERYQAHYKNQIKQQQDAGKRARDAGPGGGTPGQAPVKRTFDEATAAALSDLSGRR
jgi:hypothetical protein